MVLVLLRRSGILLQPRIDEQRLPCGSLDAEACMPEPRQLDALQIHLVSAFFPAAPSADKRYRILEAHLLQRLRRERRTAATTAVAHDLRVLVGRGLVDVDL